jgi:hypothetical protein
MPKKALQQTAIFVAKIETEYFLAVCWVLRQNQAGK